MLIGAGAAVLLVGGAAVAFGPGLYAGWADRTADDAPSLATSGAPLGDPAALDGEWAVTDGSYAGYRVSEVLRGENATVTGRTEQVTGTVTIATGEVTAGRIEVDVASIQTDQAARDAYFRGSVMQVGTHPTATFALTEPVPLTAGEARVRLPGELTVHGVTRDVEVEAEVAATGAGAQVIGSVPVTFADYDVVAPSLGFVRVDESGTVEFSLELVRSDAG
jgi:polyisoprenoid-binding protein YceI